MSYEEKRKQGKVLQGESEQLYQKLLSQMRTKPLGHVEVTADLEQGNFYQVIGGKA